MNKMLAVMLAVIAFAVNADGLLGDSAGTNRLVTSKTVTELGWRRNVVSVDELGQIGNDDGVVAQTAETEAINSVAENSAVLADAATESMNESMNFLLSKTNNMANAGLGIAIAFKPETDDPNIRGFVVKTETLNNEDIQWVWYNAELALPPVRFVTYETYDKSYTAKVKWDTWDAAGTNITVNGHYWTGVHRCKVARPAWAASKSCLDLPNETWGGENGISWGAMTITKSGIPYFTGFVTNSVTHEIAYFDNGFLKEVSTYNE